MAKIMTTFIFIIILIGISACTAPGNASSPEAGKPVQVEIEVRDELKLVANEIMVSQADAIFKGRVDWIGPSIWVDGVAHHQLAVSMLQPIVDEANLGSGGILTIAGPSPLDNVEVPSTAAMRRDAQPSHHLEIGDEAIFIVQQTEISGEGHYQPVLTTFSDVTQSILSVDLMDALILQVQQQRPYQAAPAQSAELGVY